MDRETPRDISQKISNGHAYTEHIERHNDFNDPRRGQPLGIHTREQLANHIYQTITDKDTSCFTTQHGHNLYYNKGTNTFIAYDPQRPDRGTCYRPTQQERHFDNAFNRDVEAHHGSPDPSRIKTGGYHALYPDAGREAATAQEREQPNARDERKLAAENEAKRKEIVASWQPREGQENLSETSRGQRERDAAYEQEAQEKQKQQEKDKQQEH